MNNTSHSNNSPATQEATKPGPDANPCMVVEVPDSPLFQATLNLSIGIKGSKDGDLDRTSFYFNVDHQDRRAIYRGLADHCRALVEYLTDMENAAIAEKAAEERRAF